MKTDFYDKKKRQDYNEKYYDSKRKVVIQNFNSAKKVVVPVRRDIKPNPIPDPVIKIIPLEIERTFFKGDIEPEVCSHFGCSRTLSHSEKLFGSKCIHHSKM